ncbi:TetR family transcriptional regulator [Umezawaea sp. Da 62-37]|uniref:TetR family transcriptional regulator n=1 Tax=Umezawaea sp. Da 62-37 TaxID=3075927 RepID=UPI0028F717DF|nr:TetR family transcriptional regulator [Umezawaea sp. Da 62-37]WNV84015.1 TetR family transcriptional regulator [Umezawaea sp. Da 62-37]
MSRAEATKARILAAATAEFSAFGIAGARVDRVAAAAEANKNLIYVYFSSKDRLFDAVFDAHVVQVLDEVPFTAEDLPSYAGALFDFYLAHPDLPRLATWHRLERGALDQLPAVAASQRSKVDAIARAQADGKVAANRSPEVVLALVFALAGTWGPASPSAIPSDDGDAARREAVVEVVRGLATR